MTFCFFSRSYERMASAGALAGAADGHQEPAVRRAFHGLLDGLGPLGREEIRTPVEQEDLGVPEDWMAAISDRDSCSSSAVVYDLAGLGFEGHNQPARGLLCRGRE